MIQAVVFDLDGTLADTSSLGNGRRVPSLLIDGGVSEVGAEVSPRPWAWSQGVSDIPAILIERGYWVGVATRSPLAYALTLLHLINADYQILKASCGAGLAKVETLLQLCRQFGIAPHEMLYCGDLPEDKDIAAKAGVSFLDARSLHDDAVLAKFPRLLNGRGEELEQALSIPTPRTAREHFLLFDYNSRLQHGPISRSDINLVEEFLERSGSSNETAASRAAISAHLLLNFPALPCRRQLQRELFSNAEPIDRGGILQGDVAKRFGLKPRLVTRRELRDDTQLREEYLTALQRVWPPLRGKQDPSLSAVACFDGDDAYIGKMLGIAKDYKRHNAADRRMRSGPEVMLERIRFMSDLIASRLDPTASRPLVSVPASGYSNLQPGQFSIRVARQVADITNRNLLPILRRVGDHYEVDPHFPRQHLPLTVDLIEDQITTGGTIIECREALEREGVRVIGVYCYSANERVLYNFSRPHSVTIESRIEELLEGLWSH